MLVFQALDALMMREEGGRDTVCSTYITIYPYTQDSCTVVASGNSSQMWGRVELTVSSVAMAWT